MEPSSMPAPPRDGAECGHDHAVEFYETSAFLVETVCAFVAPALLARNSAVVVATPEHREAFATALSAAGVDVDAAIVDGRYVVFDAAELLSMFMVDGAPHPGLFREVVGAVLSRASAGGRQVKVYGEMVALLWADGDVTSTIALEDLWNDLAAEHSFALLCAYPLQGFDDAARAAFKRICTQHSAVIPAESYSLSVTADEQQRIVAGLQQETVELRAELQRMRDAQAVQDG
jgi:hypothetical protein